MSDGQQYSLDAARAAAERDELGSWVRQFLSSPGSDNAVLAEELSQRLRWWIGPVRVELDRLNRLAGPPGEPVLVPVDEEFWDDRVDDMEDRIDDGWEPAPVIASCSGEELVLEDGNHRVESLRRAGRDWAWTIVGFEDQAERDSFASQTDEEAAG